MPGEALSLPRKALSTLAIARLTRACFGGISPHIAFGAICVFSPNKHFIWQIL